KPSSKTKVNNAKSTPKAESSQKKGGTGTDQNDSKPIEVAAAIAVTISIVDQKATLPATLSLNSHSFATKVSAKGNTDSTAKADGAATAVSTGDTNAKTIGAAVAVNVALVTTEASIGARAHIS